MPKERGLIFKDIPQYQGGLKKEVFNCNNGCFMQRITDTSYEEYNQYKKALKKAGYFLYDSHIIKNNHYATYINDTFLIQLNYNEGITRIIADPNTNLYKRQKDVTYNKSCETVLYQMEVDYRKIDCGMCYIIQCADGSFFLIDSGHMNSVNDHERLYHLLSSLLPKGEKIIISGWFFSHAHQDHIAKFMDFLKAEYRNCEIECLYYNFPDLNVAGSEKWSDSDKQTMREFDELVQSYREIPHVKLHTGQRFFVRNLEFEVLASHEDIYPKDLGCFNDSSTILLMTVEECKTLFLGDANFTECDILISRYGDYLKSNIVQVAHHGYNDNNVEIYHYVNAKVALYPTRQDKFIEHQFTKSNKKVALYSKEIYIAGNGTTALKLPYKDKTAVVYDKEINY